MKEEGYKKVWYTSDGVLGFENNLGFTIPSAEEIYSAVFENGLSEAIDNEDLNHLLSRYTFSRYPADLKIVIESTEEYKPKLIIYAVSEHCKKLVNSLQNRAEHIIIENTWYPFIHGALDKILQILNASDIVELGEINLKQYISLLKNSEDEISNQVQTGKITIPEEFSNEKPPNIKAELYPYQLKGWKWLRFMKQGKIGGILADEMGLGKTLQIIALISSETNKEVFPSLIICPTTLLENWRREFQKFAPQINTIIHQGSTRTGFPNKLKQYDIVISSYETAVRDNSLFSQIQWKLIICDEAQAIKNASTKRAISVKKLPRESGFAVTGTPIENRLTDLWSIMDFAVPGLLGGQADFETKYESSLNGPAKLQVVVSPLILRRKVSEVAKDLPKKIIIPQVLELSRDEIFQYEQIREETMNEFESNASLVVLNRLRLFCAHPFLISDIPNADPVSFSNKYLRLVEIVEEIVDNSSKVLVFTSFNKMNDIIVSDLGKRFDIYSASIDGRTDTINRQKIVDRFSSVKGSGILVLNPIAAGTGLNITAANHVIHYNLEWNPAKEDQASARAYRRGQDRPVTIHRMFYSNTVEEAIDERLNRKREIAGEAIVGVRGEENEYADILNAIKKSPKDKQ